MKEILDTDERVIYAGCFSIAYLFPFVATLIIGALCAYAIAWLWNWIVPGYLNGPAMSIYHSLAIVFVVLALGAIIRNNGARSNG